MYRLELEEPETWWENTKFEILYFFQEQKYKIRKIQRGFENFWKYKSIIWNDRWYDYDFLVRIIEYKIKDMESHWGVDTHYVDDEVEKKLLQELSDILKQIEIIENSDTLHTTEISKLYEQFGIKLFGRNEKGVSRIETLWD